jgi:hypothetical protein
MSRENVSLVAVVNPEVRNDGATAKFTLLGAHNKSVVVTAPFEKLKTLEIVIMQLLTLAGANSSIATETPVEYDPAMESYLVNGLDVVFHPEQGNLDLRVVPTNGEALQISFLPHHVDGLRNVFREIEKVAQVRQNPSE